MTSGVLIIEDEPTLAKNFKAYLERTGFVAKVAVTGIEGLVAFEDFKPDIVLLNYKLPDINGLEILQRLRATDASVKVIMVTGEGSVEIAVKAMQAGACDYLSKPVVLKELKLHIEKVIGQARIESQLSYHQHKAASSCKFGGMMGDSLAIRALKDKISQFVKFVKAAVARRRRY